MQRRLHVKKCCKGLIPIGQSSQIQTLVFNIPLIVLANQKFLILRIKCEFLFLNFHNILDNIAEFKHVQLIRKQDMLRIFAYNIYQTFHELFLPWRTVIQKTFVEAVYQVSIVFNVVVYGFNHNQAAQFIAKQLCTNLVLEQSSPNRNQKPDFKSVSHIFADNSFNFLRISKKGKFEQSSKSHGELFILEKGKKRMVLDFAKNIIEAFIIKISHISNDISNTPCIPAFNLFLILKVSSYFLKHKILYFVLLEIFIIFLQERCGIDQIEFSFVLFSKHLQIFCTLTLHYLMGQFLFPSQIIATELCHPSIIFQYPQHQILFNNQDMSTDTGMIQSLLLEMNGHLLNISEPSPNHITIVIDEVSQNLSHSINNQILCKINVNTVVAAIKGTRPDILKATLIKNADELFVLTITVTYEFLPEIKEQIIFSKRQLTAEESKLASVRNLKKHIINLREQVNMMTNIVVLDGEFDKNLELFIPIPYEPTLITWTINLSKHVKYIKPSISFYNVATKTKTPIQAIPSQGLTLASNQQTSVEMRFVIETKQSDKIVLNLDVPCEGKYIVSLEKVDRN